MLKFEANTSMLKFESMLNFEHTSEAYAKIRGMLNIM